MTDPINPDYYKTAPKNSAIHGECIDYATDLGFVLGSAFKYVWLSLIHISEPTRLSLVSRMPSSA